MQQLAIFVVTVGRLFVEAYGFDREMVTDHWNHKTCFQEKGKLCQQHMFIIKAQCFGCLFFAKLGDVFLGAYYS